MVGHLIALVAACGTALVTAAAAAPAGNPADRRASGRPPVISGNEWTCSYTDPEFMIHAGGATIAVSPGSASFRVTSSPPGRMTGPYLTAGYMGSLDSALCNRRALPGRGRHGRSPKVPVKLGKQGHPVATVKDWTAASFTGDAGFDIWLTTDDRRSTYDEMANGGADTTEVMIWLSHPGLGRYPYYPVWIDGRRWMVTIGLASLGHGRNRAHPNGWNVVNLIAPQTSEGLVSVHNLSLDPLLSYAIRHGWLKQDTYLMSVDQGFELFRGTAAVERYALSGLA